MPVILGALLAAGIAGGASFGGALAVGTAFAVAWKGAAVIAGLTFIARLLEDRNRNTTVDKGQVLRAASLPARWIIGEVRVGGQLVFYDEKNISTYRSSTPRPHVCNMALVISEGSVESIEKLWVDGVEIRIISKTDTTDGKLLNLDSRWNPYIKIYEYFAADGTGGSSLRSESSRWTNRHRLVGKSWIHIKLIQNDYEGEYNDRIFTHFPEINFLIKGIKFTWPGQTTPIYSNSAAVVRYWWLTQRSGVPVDIIDLSSFNAAQLVCTEGVNYTLPVQNYREYNGNSIRYPVNGLITSEDDPQSVTSELDFCWQGYVVESDARLYFRPGVNRPITQILTEKDIIDTESIQVAPILQNRINAMSMSIEQSSAKQYQNQNIPKQRDLNNQQIRDNNQELWTDLGVRRFINDPIVAGRLLVIALRRAQVLSTYVYRIKPGQFLQWLTILPGDWITLENPSLGLNGTMLVTGVVTNEDWSVTLTIQPQGDNFYEDPPISNILPPEVADPVLPPGSPGDGLDITDPFVL